MKSLIFRWLCSMTLVLLTAAACTAGDIAMEKTSVSEKADIVAGDAEPTFTEHFSVELHLPVPEAEFRSLLEANGIDFRIIDSNKNEVLPLPRHRKDADSTAFQKMYEIYGGVDAHQRIGKRFRAYVDSSGVVVYIENAFSYTGP